MPNLTTKQQLDWASETLKSSKIENPQLEAEVLLAHVLKVDRTRLLTLYNREFETKETEKLRNFLERRLKREPLQYITGIAHFMSLAFEVTPEVLIPRPETELVVETVINLLGGFRGQGSGARGKETLLATRNSILDIGTGSGAIAVSLAHYLPEVEIVATDVSEGIIKVAKRNADKHGVSNRCKFGITNLYEALSRFNVLTFQRFNVIVSNPPYIPTLDIPKLQPELQFEPRSALDGGADGLDYYRKIIPEAKALLKENGYLVLEVGEGQAAAVKDFLEQNKYREIRIFKDYGGVERVVVGLSSGC